MYQSEQINEISTALSKAQSEIGPAMKDNYNPFFKSKYADLGSVWAACKEPLTKNGLSVVQTMQCENGQTLLITLLAHTSGQWIKSVLPINPVKNDPQGLGSAITYLRRYSLAAITGVTTEDDDGQSASASSKTRSSAKTTVALPIGKNKASELIALLEECDDIFQKNFIKYLASRIDGFTKIESLPLEMFDQVRGWIMKERNKKQTSNEEVYG